MATFRTKRGTCAIADGEVHIDEHYTGLFKRYYEGARSSKRGFVLVIVGMSYLPVQFTVIVLNQRWMLPYLLGGIVGIAVLASIIDHLRGFRRVETIPLDAITDITVVNGSRWTHPRFIIRYKHDDQLKNGVSDFPHDILRSQPTNLQRLSTYSNQLELFLQAMLLRQRLTSRPALNSVTQTWWLAHHARSAFHQKSAIDRHLSIARGGCEPPISGI